MDQIASFLGGPGRDVRIVDAGHLREIDLGVEIPGSPLAAVCSHEVWAEIYDRMVDLIEQHRTTLIFVNTRKLAERIAARLTERLGQDRVSCHHGSLSKQRRFDAEQRLKEGRLRALVATASLELGIDIGDVDLVIQVGSSRSIATLLQRVGRAGHALHRIPKGRIFPLTLDELVESAALLRAVGRGELDRTNQPRAPLDILAQQIVAACVSEVWSEDGLFDTIRRSWPYRNLERQDFDAVVRLHTQGRRALLHRDGIGRRLLSTRRARLAAITSGGAIADTANYDVVMDPEGTFVGTLHEDFAVESNAGDIFQLGNTSWRVLRIEQGRVRVADAKGQPPTLPFWLGEAPARTAELSAEIGIVREEGAASPGLPESARRQIADYLEGGRRVLGAVPTQRRVIVERFFDESGGMQLVLHAPFGGRINRAWGLALRKRFCRRFGFELQAAANEEAIVLSLGPQHSFPLEEIFQYLHPNSAREILVQALLAAPMFETRWRWNVIRSLRVERMQGGKKIPAPLLRMRADDELAAAFPQAAACFETLPPGDIPVPMDHPLVRQTIEDCLTEAMDIDGFLQVLAGLWEGRIEKLAVDTPEPSVFAHGILSAQPYAFLDDAPLEERRTQAVLTRRALDIKTADTIGALDPEAIRRVREEVWPQPENAEELHEALLWMGYLTSEEGLSWQAWLDELKGAGRVVLEGGRWFAAEAPRDAESVMQGRLESLGPIVSEDPVLLQLEQKGVAMRCRFEEQSGWCHRRLLARIQRYTVERLRREIEPVAPAVFLRFLACWQHVDADHRLEGPAGVQAVLEQLAGFEVPAAAWEASVLKARVLGYRPEWLDQLTASGEFVWGRLWGAGSGPIRTTPICLIPRQDLHWWLGLTGASDLQHLSAYALQVYEVLAESGAVFLQDLERRTKLLPSQLEMGIAELVTRGALTGDWFASLRQIIVPPSRRQRKGKLLGRISLFRAEAVAPPEPEVVALQLLRRTGVVFRRTILREKQPLPWRDLVRAYRRLELRGEVRGGRFVAGFDGEQYALPDAIPLLRAARRRSDLPLLSVSAADPLNFRGILTPDERVSPLERRRVPVFG
jgi:ATP-dependent Lhr-like helicase